MVKKLVSHVLKNPNPGKLMDAEKKCYLIQSTLFIQACTIYARLFRIPKRKEIRRSANKHDAEPVHSGAKGALFPGKTYWSVSKWKQLNSGASLVGSEC